MKGQIEYAELADIEVSYMVSGLTASLSVCWIVVEYAVELRKRMLLDVIMCVGCGFVFFGVIYYMSIMKSIIYLVIFFMIPIVLNLIIDLIKRISEIRRNS